jgi:hypothetical protein
MTSPVLISLNPCSKDVALLWCPLLSMILPTLDEPMPRDTPHRVTEAKHKRLVMHGIHQGERINIAFDHIFGGSMDSNVKRGPAFKAELIPAILNVMPDGRSPARAELPVKFQTRRLSEPKCSEGDEIALREPFRLGQWYPGKPVVEVRYKAMNAGRWAYPSEPVLRKIKAWKEPGKIKPGLYMPTDFSRIVATVTGKRLEPLKAITPEDAITEGIERTGNLYKDYLTGCFRFDHPIPAFKSLWDQLHGLRAFEENPKVWVLEWRLKCVALCSRGKLLPRSSSGKTPPCRIRGFLEVFDDD